jgi:ATP/maltotriose-dependent transcriptional regulator MalT
VSDAVSPAPRPSEDVLLAAIERATTLVQERIDLVVDPNGDWVDRVRGGLCALLELFDEQPSLARMCVVQSLAGSARVLARRGQVVDQLAWVVDEGRAAARRQPPALTAQGVVTGALGVIHARLLQADGGRLAELLNQLMSFIVMPYLGRASARIELHRPISTSPKAVARRTPSKRPSNARNPRLTPRTVRVLDAIASRPGLSNSELGERAGVTDAGQISKLATRLARHGLIESRPRAVTHAWRLTAEGYDLVASVRTR